MKHIPIKCSGSRTMLWHELKDFQCRLKEMSKEDYQKLRHLILTYGWITPVFVWDGFILDGHGRLKVLAELIKEGYTIDPIPVSDIEADNRQDAAKMLLAINSQFQKITEDGLYEYLTVNEISFDVMEMEVTLPDIDIDHFRVNFYEDIEFKPGTEDEQGKLDEKKKIKCPDCGYEFTG